MIGRTLSASPATISIVSPVFRSAIFAARFFSASPRYLEIGPCHPSGLALIHAKPIPCRALRPSTIVSRSLRLS